MQYHLDPGRLSESPWITVVGCGGTGGFVAEALCRLFTGRDATIFLVDHDQVEPHNVLRQNFYAADVGGYKSEVLAKRLSRSYGRTVGYSTLPFAEYKDSGAPVDGYPGLPRRSVDADRLLIGCVDNAAARRSMARCSGSDRALWWIDAGNGTKWGQVLVGNHSYWRMPLGAGFVDEQCRYLPLPTVQRPDLLTTVPDTPPDVDCAAALDLTDQDPTINHMMASWVAQVVRRLVAGICPWMSLYVDLENGAVNPVYATPENVAKVVERLPSEQEEAGPEEDGTWEDERYEDDYFETAEGC